MDSLNPQGELFAIWRRWSAATRDSDHEQRWSDVANTSNSILDAEILTCLLLPAFQLDRFSLTTFGFSSADAVASLSNTDKMSSLSERQLSDEDMQHILDMLEGFFNRNIVDEIPSFRVGTYATVPEIIAGPMPSDVEELEVTDSYGFSISVCLYTLLLVQRWKNMPEATRQDHIVSQWSRIGEKANARLTYALAGLLSCFCVNLLSPASWQANTGHEWVAEDMREIRDRLIALGANIGLSDAFNVGWSWGPVPQNKRLTLGLEVDDLTAPTPRGHHQREALPAPYFYFTMGALDSIAGLNDRKVQSANFLDPTQLIMASRLLQYWHITIDYWTKLAFSSDDVTERWTIEDIPWTAADAEATDYWSLYVLGIVTRGDAQAGHRLNPGDIERLIPLVEDMANRARITRRPVPNDTDPALMLHSPGHIVKLADAEDQVVLHRLVYDFAPRLLKLCGRLLAITSEEDSRERILALANQVWFHLSLRRVPPTNVDGKNTSCWDTLGYVYKGFKDTRDLAHTGQAIIGDPKTVASWYMTERVTEALVALEEARSNFKPITANVDQIVQELATELEYLASSDLTSQMNVESETYSEILNGLQQARLAATESSAMALSKLFAVAEQLEEWKRTSRS